MLTKEQLEAHSIKPEMPEKGIIEKVSVDIEVKLASDYDRFSNGSFLMSISNVPFKTGDNSIEGSLRVSVGGNEADVQLGQRTWRINLSALVQAALDADEKYLKEQRQ